MEHVDGSIAVRVVAVDPPFQDQHGLMFGLQEKGGDVDAVPATATATFETRVTVVGLGEGSTDFKGPHVHGKKGDRFLYVSWGADDGVQPFVMFARAKLKLADIPSEVLDKAGTTKGVVLRCRFQATNTKGQPASGSIRPPAVAWSVHN